MEFKEIRDRLELRELVEMVSILGDKKDFNAQVLLFTEDAISETLAGGVPVLKLSGRKEMAEAFNSFLKEVETVYHFNGQQVLSINGDRANGTCYCLVTLIGHENGKKMKTTIGVIYEDNYVRNDNRWLISRRLGNFEWQGKQEMDY
jgi:hypothetical protein